MHAAVDSTTQGSDEAMWPFFAGSVFKKSERNLNYSVL